MLKLLLSFWRVRRYVRCVSQSMFSGVDHTALHSFPTLMFRETVKGDPEMTSRVTSGSTIRRGEERTCVRSTPSPPPTLPVSTHYAIPRLAYGQMGLGIHNTWGVEIIWVVCQALHYANAPWGVDMIIIRKGSLGPESYFKGSTVLKRLGKAELNCNCTCPAS